LLWEFQHGAFLNKTPDTIAEVRHSILLIDEVPIQTREASALSALNTISPSKGQTTNTIPSEPARQEKNILSTQSIETTNKLAHDTPSNLAEQETSNPDIKKHAPYQGAAPKTTPLAKNLSNKSVTSEIQEIQIENGKKENDSNQLTNIHCLTKQPFKSKKAAEQWLKNQSTQGRIEKIERTIPSSYLVYIPAADNITQAQQTVKNLQQKGIKDFWLFRQGPMKNAISLGLFIKQYRAEKLVKQMQKKGIDVKLEIRYKSMPHWVVISSKKAETCLQHHSPIGLNNSDNTASSKSID
jgi:hypothetical protein